VNLGNFARRDGNGRDLLPALVQDRDTPFRRTRRRVGSDLPRDDFARCPSPPPRHGSPHLRDRLIDHRYLDRNNIAACYYLSHLSKTNATTSFPFRLERTAPRQLEIRIMFLGGLRALPRPKSESHELDSNSSARCHRHRHDFHDHRGTLFRGPDDRALTHDGELTRSLAPQEAQ